MVDTIHFRLHCAQEHEAIFFAIESETRGEARYLGRTTEEGMKTFLQFNIMEFRETGKLMFQYRDNLIEPSSHYKVQICKRPMQDYIEFNLSVPKYLFGTNVLQFIQHQTEHSRVYDVERAGTWKWQAAMSHERLLRFIKLFFADWWPQQKVNFRHVEIVRIDLCYNQVFPSKQDALDYLELQKGINKRYARSVSKVMNKYQTAIFYHSNDASFKIYHKGTEYQASDRVQHEYWNKRVKRRQFDVEKIQEFSDRILRYEMTFRKGYMSRVFRTKIFRRKDEVWLRRMKVHDIMAAKEAKAMRTSEAIAKAQAEGVTLDVSGRYTMAQFLREEKSTLTIYRQTKKWIAQSADFFLQLTKEEADYNRGSDIHKVRVVEGNAWLRKPAMFSIGLYAEMCNRFRVEFEHWQVKETTHLTDVAKRAASYNQTVALAKSVGLKKSKVNIGAVKQFMALSNLYSRHEMIVKGFYSKATVNRYIRQLKKIGIDGTQHHAPRAIPASRGYVEYNHALLVNGMSTRHKFFH